jgi:hypothetical protein
VSPGTAEPLPAANPGAAGVPRAASIGVAEPLRAVSIAVAPGPQTTAVFVLPLVIRRIAVRPAKARAAGPHRAAGLAGRRRQASVARPRRAATSVAPGGQTTPGHGGPPRVTQGEVRVRRANGRPRVMAAATVHMAAVTVPMAAVTGHRAQPAAGHAAVGQATPPRAAAGPAPGTRHAQARPRPAVTPRPISPGRTFLIRSAPSSSTRKRGPS